MSASYEEKRKELREKAQLERDQQKFERERLKRARRGDFSMSEPEQAPAASDLNSAVERVHTPPTSSGYDFQFRKRKVRREGIGEKLYKVV